MLLILLNYTLKIYLYRERSLTRSLSLSSALPRFNDGARMTLTESIFDIQFRLFTISFKLHSLTLFMLIKISSAKINKNNFMNK